MPDYPPRILDALARPSYTPLKPKDLAKRLGVGGAEYPAFRRALRELLREGRIAQSQDNTLRASDPFGTVAGTYRRTNSGLGFVRPHEPTAATGPEIRVREGRERDASSGDEVLVKLTRKAGRLGTASGDIVGVTRRATRTFVGTYFERDGQGFVRVDGSVFAHSVDVGDPGAKGARKDDKVVLEMLRFPTATDRGEGVITEVLGPLGKPGVDLMAVIKAHGLPEEFPPAALEEAREVAGAFRDDDLQGRTDFTGDVVVTIDPADARDFDDAVGVEIDPRTGHWVLSVHIADVAHFAPAGGPLDAEARRRGTSVYLPQRVIPMFPEVISNGVASLQAGRLRFVKTARMEFTPDLQKGAVRFFNGAIRARRRFSYEEVRDLLPALDGPAPAESPVEPEVRSALRRMRDLAGRLRKKRLKRGSLELSMPEAVLEYTPDGKVSGAHFAENDFSHQMIEEFMLAANVAVAEQLTHLGVPFLRRVHPAPNEDKLEAFAQFADLLGHRVRKPQDRFELQKLLDATADKPERAAIHYALLRSFKQATYSPIQDEHYALAFPHYCHFTSPIRRYPDLVVHRQLDRFVRTGKSVGNTQELAALGEHCSRMERRAEAAERELVKLKILQYLSDKIGTELDAVITGVADYGFFAQAERFPAEGMVPVAALTDDYYRFDEEHRALFGSRSRRRFRLGDRVRVVVARVDLARRQLDFRLSRKAGRGA